MQDMANAGLTWLRVDVPFNGEIDRAWNVNWYSTDEIDQAVAHGLKVDALLSYAPDWAKGTDGSPNPSSFARFAAAAVAHLAPLGVQTFEIWNEPNLAENWGTRVSPVEYGQVLEAAYPAIKAVDPSAVVLSAGLAPASQGSSDTAMSPIAFLTALYAEGGNRFLDGVADHPYTYPSLPDGADPSNQFAVLLQIRELMVQHGDAAKRIWITEYGAPTAGAGAVSDSSQAAMISAALRYARRWPWSGPVFLYSWQDDPTDGYFGLTNSDGTPKVALAVVSGSAREQRGPP